MVSFHDINHWPIINTYWLWETVVKLIQLPNLGAWNREKWSLGRTHFVRYYAFMSAISTLKNGLHLFSQHPIIEEGAINMLTSGKCFDGPLLVHCNFLELSWAVSDVLYSTLISVKTICRHILVVHTSTEAEIAALCNYKNVLCSLKLTYVGVFSYLTHHLVQQSNSSNVATLNLRRVQAW